MTTGLCLFCNGQKKNYKPEPNKDFICSRCVILLAGAEQGDLKKAYVRAIVKGFKDKVSALQSFIVEDEYNAIVPQQAQDLYLTICVLNRLNVPVRAGVVSRLHDIPFEYFKEHLFQPLEHVDPSHMGKPYIEEHEVDVFGRCGIEALVTVLSQKNIVLFVLQDVFQDGADTRLVVDNQYAAQL